jgi:predicted secreted protein
MADRRDVERLIASGRRLVLNGAHLASADLTSLDLSNADLSYADLTGARLDDAILRNAKLWSVVAPAASFVRSDLRGANIMAANLRGANLTGARLGGAVLTGTDLTAAVMEGTELPQSGLSDAIVGATSAASELTLSVDREGNAGGPSRTVLDEYDSGRHVTVPVGATIDIDLSEGATGYRWAVALEESSGVGSVVVAHSPRYESPTSTAAGAFRRVVFPVTAVAPGYAEIVLVLRQPWNPESEPDRRFKMRATVR